MSIFTLRLPGVGKADQLSISSSRTQVLSVPQPRVSIANMFSGVSIMSRGYKALYIRAVTSSRHRLGVLDRKPRPKHHD